MSLQDYTSISRIGKGQCRLLPFWFVLLTFHSVFRHWDADHSGTIEERELAGALSGFGYNLPPHLIRMVVAKYSTTPVGGYNTPPPSITFDRFVRYVYSFSRLIGYSDEACAVRV